MATKINPADLLTPTQAAALLDCSRTTFYAVHLPHCQKVLVGGRTYFVRKSVLARKDHVRGPGRVWPRNPAK